MFINGNISEITLRATVYCIPGEDPPSFEILVPVSKEAVGGKKRHGLSSLIAEIWKTDSAEKQNGFFFSS